LPTGSPGPGRRRRSYLPRHAAALLKLLGAAFDHAAETSNRCRIGRIRGKVGFEFGVWIFVQVRAQFEVDPLGQPVGELIQKPESLDDRVGARADLDQASRFLW